jgi:2',3'-cyclic-nucleotide 2'-phosphodiesterase/3'-nucleotidase
VLFVIGILFGAAIGTGSFIALIDRQRLEEIDQYQEQIQTLNGVIESQDAEISLLKADQEVLEEEIIQLHGQIEELASLLVALEGQLEAMQELLGESTETQEEPQEIQEEETEGPVEITIFHINDLHGRVVSQDPQDGMVGGVAKIAYLVNQEREAGSNVIFLNAGDCIYGTILTTYYDGIPTVESMNAADLDAMTIGNHEYDFGLDPMLGAWAASNFPWLGSNIIDSTTGTNPEYLYESVLLDVGGIDVALVGFMDLLYVTGLRYEEVSNLDLHFSYDFVDSLVSELDPGSDLIVALSHIGYNADIDLAENTEGIDVIVGGHSHTKLDEPQYVDGTVIVQAWNHGLVLGRLDLTVEDDQVTAYSGELIQITEDIPDDPDVAAVLQPYVDEYGPIMEEVVGETLVDLNALTDALRGRDTNAGNLVAEAMLWQAGDADIAMHNVGGFRWKRVFPVGGISRADCHELLRFQNNLVVADFTGEEVRLELEYCAMGGWIQVEGVRFTYDPSLPEGERVVEATVGGEPLDDGAVYRVAMGKFIADGGSGHWPLTLGENYDDRGIFLADCLVNYLQEFSPVSPEADGRITPIE